jgi:uncharacterized protein (TIGR02246 family)
MKVDHRIWTLSFIVCICLSVVFATGGCSRNRPVADEAAKAGNNDEAGIRQWMDLWTKAVQARDVNAIAALYAPDVVAYDVVPPLQYVGWDAYRKDYEWFLAQYKGPLEVEVRDVHVSVQGDLAFARGLERWSGTLANGEKSSIWMRFTSVFRKSNGKWLDIHDHASVPVDFATGKAKMDLNP